MILALNKDSKSVSNLHFRLNRIHPSCCTSGSGVELNSEDEDVEFGYENIAKMDAQPSQESSENKPK
jgi:hypothetical protein